MAIKFTKKELIESIAQALQPQSTQTATTQTDNTLNNILSKATNRTGVRNARQW